ncbi:MAG: shikimate kinase [Abitibacteriaceae bacterium]|nr:shikimate kinase [Abditibacteriaceae bacterium]
MVRFANVSMSPSPTVTPGKLCPLVLIGFMGSGKSCVARLLAQYLNREAIDLDKCIEQIAGCTIAQLFATRGEAAFRDLETQALQTALQAPSILATGGGVITRATNREVLQSCPDALVVYLRAQPDTLAARIRRQPGKRPLIDGNGAILNMEQTQARVEQLLAERETYYEDCANLIIETDNLRPVDIAQRIVAALADRAGV